MLALGSGELTRNLAKLVGGGRVVGIDASADMIDKASSDSGDHGGTSESGQAKLEFAVVDGQQLTEWLAKNGKQATFDRVFSSAAVSSPPGSRAVKSFTNALLPHWACSA